LIGFVLYIEVAVAAWRVCAAGTPAALAVARAAAFTIAAPALILSALAGLGVSPGPWAGPAVLVVVLMILLVLGGRAGAAPTGAGRAALESLAWASVLALVCPRIGIGPSTIALDGMAHLAWSRDLVGASPFYVLGFPAFTSTLTAGDPLVGAFRVAPAILSISLFATLISLGRAAGSTLAGLGGCLLFLAMPQLQARLYPALPELMACPLVFASWVELVEPDRRPARTALWLGFLSCALTVVHVSTMEIVHLIALGLVVLAAPGRLLSTRLLVIGSVLAGVVIGVALSPMLLAILRGEGLLLVDEQPSFLTPFSLRQLGAAWGIAADLAILGGAVLGVMVWRGLRPRAPVLLGLSFAFLVLLLPTFLAAVGIQVSVQVFTSRLFIAATYFAIAAWVVVIAQGSAVRPRLVAFLVVLPAAGIFFRLRSSVEHLVVASVAAFLALLLYRAMKRSIRQVAAIAIAVLLLINPARLWIWYPEDPPWVRFLVERPSAGSVLLTHWPPFNQAQARAPFPTQVGLAGADAQLPLHAIEKLPDLRHQLRWSADSFDSDREALRDWVGRQETEEVLVLVHRDIGRAWDGYAQTWNRRQADGLDPGASVYRSPPVEESVDARLDHIVAVLRSLPASELVFEDAEARIFRLSPFAVRGDSRS
jgi:hypothetical protein